MWKYVESSNILAIKIEGNDLLIRFYNSGTYKYFGADHEFNAMVNANSVGSFFHQNIKGKYEYERI